MRLLIILLASLAFTGCGSDSSSSGGEEAKATSDAGVGPFPLALSKGTATVENQFDVPIKQSEGKVEFILPAQTDIYWMKFEDSDLSVTGCDIRNVALTESWKNEPTDPGTLIVPGQHFAGKPGKEGRVVVALRNLSGCTSVSYVLRVKLVSADKVSMFGKAAATCFGNPYGNKVDLFQGYRDSSGTHGGYMIYSFPSDGTIEGPYTFQSGSEMVDVKGFFAAKDYLHDLVGSNGSNKLIITFLRSSTPELFLGGGRYVSLNCVMN